MIHIRNLPKKNKKYIVAFSAGVDSVSCANVLWRLGYDITLAHYHHGFQSDNDKMVEKASEYARAFGIPLFIGYNTEEVSEKNVEANLRNKRLEFYRKLGGDIICCQHLNDAMESFFINCMNDGGRCHMPTKTKLEGTDYHIFRPFLLTEKAEINEYSSLNNLDRFVFHDTSNDDTRYLRNYVRHCIMPILPEKLGLKNTVKKQIEKLYKKDKENA